MDLNKTRTWSVSRADRLKHLQEHRRADANARLWVLGFCFFLPLTLKVIIDLDLFTTQNVQVDEIHMKTPKKKKGFLTLTLKDDLDLSPLKMCSSMRYTCMPNIKLLSSIMQKLWPMLKFSDDDAYYDANDDGRREGYDNTFGFLRKQLSWK